MLPSHRNNTDIAGPMDNYGLPTGGVVDEPDNDPDDFMRILRELTIVMVAGLAPGIGHQDHARRPS